jgi:hypothetical protein
MYKMIIHRIIRGSRRNCTTIDAFAERGTNYCSIEPIYKKLYIGKDKEALKGLEPL